MRLLILKIAALAVTCFLAVSLYLDERVGDLTRQATAFRTLEDATHLLQSMREIYRERIVRSGVLVFAEALPLCPGSVIGAMSRRFDNDGKHDIAFANVSDRPRNPANLADAGALAAIAHFREHPDELQHFSRIEISDGNPGFQMALPLWTEAACLICHGERATALEHVRNQYTEGFGYQAGELRGVLLARIGEDKLKSKEVYRTRLAYLFLALLAFGLVLFIAFDRLLLARLSRLEQAMAGVEDGQLQPLEQGRQGDALDAVIDGFNDMVHALGERERALSAHARTIAQQKLFLNSIIDSLKDPVMVIGNDYRILESNRAARNLIGRRYMADGANYCYRALHGLEAPCSPEQRICPLKKALAQGSASYIRHHLVDGCGQSALYDVSAVPLRDGEGQVCGVVESIHDVTALVRQEHELRRSRERLDQQAHSDLLTGLPNRRSFEEWLQQALADADEAGDSVGLAFLDLDGFKDVNDALGHPVGDQLLQIVAERLRACVRQGDFVGRLAGDEFVIVLRGLLQREPLQRVAEQVMAVQREPVMLGGNAVFVTGSIGLALYPQDAQTAEGLLKMADIAMYAAKNAGRNCIRHFTPEMDEVVRNRFALIHDLRAALARNEFFLVFQPQFLVADGRLRGVEALLRWRSPERGLVQPDAFIHLLEEGGLMRELGTWLLDECLRQLRSWLDAGMPEFVMSINVSAEEFEEQEFLEHVLAALERYRIPPALLELEITERIALHNLERAVDLLGRLRAAGIRTALDDFGTGYSSLSYLTTLPIDTLKIDRSFIRTLPESEKSRGVVQLISGLGHLMKMEIVAEGVETEAELALVRAAGCECVQGYYYAPPLTVAGFAERIAGLENRQSVMASN